MSKNLIISAIIITIVAAGVYFVVTKKPQSSELKNKTANQGEAVAGDCHKKGFIGPCPKENKEKASTPTVKNAIIKDDLITGFYPSLTPGFYDMLSIFADGTYRQIFPQKDEYVQLSGKWKLETEADTSSQIPAFIGERKYHLIPDTENSELGFREMHVYLTNQNTAIRKDDGKREWYRETGSPEFPGVSPLGNWTAKTDSGTAVIKLDSDWRFQYILADTSSTMKDEWWAREGDYIYDVDNWKRKSGIWEPLKAVPMIRIDTDKKKILFIDEDGEEIEMKRE